MSGAFDEIGPVALGADELARRAREVRELAGTALDCACRGNRCFDPHRAASLLARAAAVIGPISIGADR